MVKNKRSVTLQESERRIMECLWDSGPMGVVPIWHALEESTGWSKSTVNTLVSRMVDKGLIAYREGRRAKEYYPCFGREEVALGETKSLLDKVYMGSVGLMISTLVDNKQLTKEDISQLYDILRKAEEGEDG